MGKVNIPYSGMMIYNVSQLTYTQLTHTLSSSYVLPCSWAPALLSQPRGIYSFLCLETSSHALVFLLQYEWEMFHHSLENLDPSREIQSLRAV